MEHEQHTDDQSAENERMRGVIDAFTTGHGRLACADGCSHQTLDPMRGMWYCVLADIRNRALR